MKTQSPHWWKSIKAQPDIRKLWQRYLELTAFRYELGRRNHNLNDTPRFIDLPAIALPHFRAKLVRESDKICCLYHGEMDVEKMAAARPGWSPALPYSYNLHASDRALCEVFMNWIKGERQRQYIAEELSVIGERSRNKGRRARPVSWKWIELIDNPQQLNDNDRSHLSVARKEMKRLQSMFNQSYGDWEFLSRHYPQECISKPWDSSPLFSRNKFTMRYLRMAWRLMYL